MSAFTLLSCGSNARGQLAIGNSEDAHLLTPCIFYGHPPGRLPDDTSAVLNIACGANHTLVLISRTSRRELWGCGDGRRGQLGPTYTASIRSGNGAEFRPLGIGWHLGLEGYAPRLIAAGWETSYVVFSCPGRSDVLTSMGADDFGDLGIGGIKARGASGQAVHVVPLLDALTDAPPLGIDGARVLTVQSLDTASHDVVVSILLTSSDGSVQEHVLGWGVARHGQLGEASASATRPPTFHPSPRSVVLDDHIRISGTIASAALGNQHTVFRHTSGRLLGIGSNKKGQLDRLDTLIDVRCIACTWNGTYALVLDSGGDSVQATGSNNHGQLGRDGLSASGALDAVKFPFTPRGRKVMQLACGSEHVLCLLECRVQPRVVESEEVQTSATPREVWGWGWNEHGNLGLGSTDDAQLPVRIWPPHFGADSKGRAAGVWGGNGTSWILLEKQPPVGVSSTSSS